MQRRARAYGPYKRGSKFRVHFVSGSGSDRTTTYEVFTSQADAQRCVDAANDEAQGVTVIAAIKAFLDFKRAQGRADLTVSAYEQRLHGLLVGYLSRPVRSIARRGAQLYEAAQAGRGADAHQNMLTVGRIWAKWCTKKGWLRADPFADVEVVGQRVHGGDKERLTIDETRKLEEWCYAHPGQDAAVTLAYLYLGTRNSELGRRNVRDLDDGGRLLRIGKTKTRAGRRALRIPEGLGDMLVAIAGGRPPDAPLFLDANGNRMSRNVARKLVRRTLAAAGVRVMPPQALRRTHAELAADAGETGYAIARALGHATGAAPKVTTQAYIGREAAEEARRAAFMRTVRGNSAENSEPN